MDGDWVESKDQDAEGDVRLIQLADVGDGVYLNRSNRFLTSNKARELRCTFLEPGDALIARMPDPLGRACIFPGDQKKSVTVVDVCIVRTGAGGANHRWLMWAINSPDFRVNVAAKQSGSTRKRISRSHLATLPLHVPPLREQQRIAEETEKQFTRLEAAVEALKRAQVNLKRYRASVLKAACEGRLVPTEAELARAEGRDYEPAEKLLARILKERRARWEADQLAKMHAAGKPPKDDRWRTKYKEPSAPDTASLPRLPEGWAGLAVAQAGETITGRTPPTADISNFGGAIPFFKPTDLDAGYNTREAREFLSEEGSRSGRLLPPGSILVTCIGATIGQTGLARVEGATNQQINALVIYRELALPEWVFWWFTSPAGQRQIKENSSATTLPILNKSRFEVLFLPVPPALEQARIVAEVERRLSVIDELEAVAEANLRRAARLRHAILKRAFEGKLVPQDPSDEPASVLLERIRAERRGGSQTRPGST